MMLKYNKCNKSVLAKNRNSCCSLTPSHTLLLCSHHTILQGFCLFVFFKVLKVIASQASVLLEELAFGLWSGQVPWITLMERRLSIGFADGGPGEQRGDTLSAKPPGWQLPSFTGAPLLCWFLLVLFLSLKYSGCLLKKLLFRGKQYFYVPTGKASAVGGERGRRESPYRALWWIFFQCAQLLPLEGMASSSS